jgi:hypothetical protein
MKKYYLLYIKYLIKFVVENKYKFIFMIITFLIGIKLDSFEDVIQTSTIISSFEYDSRYIYVIIEEDKKELIDFSEPQEIKNNTISYKKRNEFNDFFLFLFILSLIVWAFIIIIGYDDETIWNRKAVYSRVIESCIYITEENGNFYYMIFDRLVSIEKGNINIGYNNNVNKLKKISDILALPVYETKVKKRENIFTILGI